MHKVANLSLRVNLHHQQKTAKILTNYMLQAYISWTVSVPLPLHTCDSLKENLTYCA